MGAESLGWSFSCRNIGVTGNVNRQPFNPDSGLLSPAAPRMVCGHQESGGRTLGSLPTGDWLCPPHSPTPAEGWTAHVQEVRAQRWLVKQQKAVLIPHQDNHASKGHPRPSPSMSVTGEGGGPPAREVQQPLPSPAGFSQSRASVLVPVPLGPDDPGSSGPSPAPPGARSQRGGRQ